MTLTQLQYAIQLAQTKNFKRAAELLHISQPALSVQIRNLEEEIGIQLFNRSSNPTGVTRDGELFLIRAREVVHQVEQLAQFADQLKEDYSSSLSIGIIPTLAPFLIPLFSQSLQQNFPDLKLEFNEQLTEDVVKNVRSGDLDVGLISTPVDVYGIRAIPLFYERFFVYASKETPISTSDIRVEDIRSEELWLLDEGNCFRDQINNFCDLESMRKDKKFVYHSNSIDALIRIVDARGGMTILPELTTLTLNSEQEENLKTIRGKPKAREVGMIIRSNYDKMRYIDLLGEYIRSNIPSFMLESKGLEILDPEIRMD